MPDANVEKAHADFVKCPTCGANLEFDPETRTLKCNYCGTEVDFEKNKQVEEINIENAFATVEKGDKTTSVYRCQNCGAEVVVNSDEVATECPFCGTPYVSKTENLNGIKPNAVYPFLIEQDKALDIAKKNIKKRFFAPTKFKRNIDAKDVKGLYYPCFTFDSNTQSTYKGRIGKNKTRTVRDRNGNTRTESYIEWRTVSGSLSHFFDDITITTSARLPQKILNKIMPFKADSICVYEKKFLAGFCANHYEKDIRTAWKEAKDNIDGQIRSLILNRYDCTVVDYLNVSTIHNGVTYKYVLLPVWQLSFKYRKKVYGMVLNGNTGKIYGKMPISPWKVFFTGLISVGIITGIYFLLKWWGVL